MVRTTQLILLLVFIISVSVMCIPRCPLEKRSFTNIPTFSINGEEKFLTVQRNIVTPFIGKNENESSCYIQVEEMFNSEENITEPRLRAYVFVCVKPTTVYLKGVQTSHKEIVSYVQIQGCSLSGDGLYVLSNLTSVTVLNVVTNSNINVFDDSSYCNALKEVGTLLISNSTQDMDIIFSCRHHLSFMAEVVFGNVSLTTLPTNISSYMPTLQSLDLTRNNFTTPPIFPWDNSTRHLPRNLSRTPFMQNQYTFGNSIDIPTNEYRREFRLDFNPYLNLSGYQFQGHLHMLSLTDCRLTDLPGDVLHKVKGLQYLSLAYNSLEDIPMELFQNAVQLHNLQLQGNRLTVLERGVFSGLKEVSRINLANNRLTHLGEGLFSGLYQLEKLSLQNNNLMYINRHAFSKLLTKLKVVNAENNPLVQIPEGLLLLRNLYDINLRGHNITDIDFTRLGKDIRMDDLKYTVADSVSTGSPNIDTPVNGLRTVDMSSGHIRKISFVPTDKYSPFKMALLLKHYKFIVTDNPIQCDCNILNYTRYVKDLKKNRTLVFEGSPIHVTDKEYAFDNWRCSLPVELEGKKLLSLLDQETYCPYQTPQCPEDCTCFIRSVTGSKIVDCRNLNLTETPKTLPEGQIELWLQDNVLKSFTIEKRLAKRIIELHIQRSRLEYIDPICISQMTNLRKLFIQDNLLSKIPQEIQSMNINVIRLGGNPLQCDCHSVWMKQWLITNRNIVQDPLDVKCVNFVEDSGRNILAVPDQDFICEKIPLYKIAVPTAVPTAMVLILLVSALVMYMFWADFKVFIYVHTGFHPFDKSDPHGSMQYDAFVAYPMEIIDWVHDHIFHPLQDDAKYVLYDAANDFKFGLSLQENVQHGVQFSRRMIVVLSEETMTDPLTLLALEAGLEKCRDDKANFIVPVIYSSSALDVDNEHLQKYFKAKRYVNISSDHFLKRLHYYMPTVPLNFSEQPNGSLNAAYENHFDTISNHKNTECDLTDILVQSGALPKPDVVDGLNPGSTVFVWYADSDFRFMMDKIVHPFEAEGHSFILSDKNFIPGAAIQENILHSVQDSDRTIIILSQDSIQDEWTLYVFRFASQRQMVDKTFLAGIIVREGMLNAECDEEIVKHLKSYQPLSEKDGKFHQKIQTFLRSPAQKERRAEPLERLINGGVNVDTDISTWM